MGEFDRWSNIHQDLFSEITKRFYSYDNYIQLRLVCKQWNLKLPKIPDGNKAPWLVLSTDSAAKEETHALEDEGILDTRSLEEKGIYHLILPDMQDNSMCGSCHGWLIIVMVYEGTIRMLNPFTKVHLDLPPISTLPNVININGDECTIYSEGKIITRNTIFMHQTQVWKAIINSAPNNDSDSDFIAVVIYGLSLELAFYMPNDKRWIRFPTRHLEDNVHDVIFFQEKIFVVDGEGQLYEFDTKIKSEPVGGKHEATPPPSIVGMLNCYYLIGGNNGSLLMLVRGARYRYCMKNQKWFGKTLKFEIYELKKNEKTWSRIYRLENYILVIGLNSSVQILPSNFLNCKGNQIYFTDEMREVYLENTTPSYEIGIFDLEDGSYQTFLTELKLQVVTPIMFIVSDLADVVNALLLAPVVVLARPENPEPSETELKRADLFFNYAYALVASRAKLDNFTIEVQVGTGNAGCG
ncbi:F-box protein SKIP23-like [Arachis hypogaea]|uniref:F-box protein SKIP23-like n=1 Tax=Arachis hypogaea TaxID=3818 RepID=UPI003B20C24E